MSTIRAVAYGSGSAVTVSCSVNDLIVVSFTNAIDTVNFTGATLIDNKTGGGITYYIAKATATSVTATPSQNSRLLVAVMY